MRVLRQKLGEPTTRLISLREEVSVHTEMKYKGKVVEVMSATTQVLKIADYIREVFTSHNMTSGHVDYVRFYVTHQAKDGKPPYPENILVIEWAENYDHDVVNNRLDIKPKYTNEAILEAIFDCFGIEDGEYLSRGVYLDDPKEVYQISSLVTAMSGTIHGGPWRILSGGFNMIFRSLIPHEEYLRKYKGG